MLRIDAHQHFWHPARGDYGWMPKDDPVLDLPYGPADLRPLLTASGVARTVLVQAAPSIAETQYLLGIADATPEVGAIVGWIDFERQDDRAQLERLSRHPAFRGVRPMIQDIPDPDWMLGAGVDWAFKALVEFDLTFDALGFPHHLENFHIVLGRHPDLRVVIDHCMKPDIAGQTPETFRHWADGMTRLARETGAFCKLSGLVTEAGPGWCAADLRPYADHVLETFGPDRVMWGSDWPVCRLRAEYDDWLAVAADLAGNLGAADRARIFGETAAKFYRIEA